MNAVDDVIEKIKKAIRLANKTTEEGERETALRLARRLAESNGIAFEEVNAGEIQRDKATCETDERYSSTLQGVEFGFTCYILYQHFAVGVMIQPKFDEPWMRKAIWFGSRMNVDIAKFVMHILLRESRRSYEALRKMAVTIEGVKPPDRTNYMQGFFWAISRKLEEHPLRNDLAEDRSLADAKMLEFKTNNSTRKTRTRRKSADADALTAGFKAGNSVNLARPCEGRQSIVPLLETRQNAVLTA